LENWISLLILLVLPLAATLYRIAVERRFFFSILAKTMRSIAREQSA